MVPRIRAFAKPSLKDAAQLVRGGGLIVYPTDTVYGLGCDPRNAAAVDRLFAAKNREPKPIPVLCDAIERVRILAEVTPGAERLAAEYWPGQLTIVLPLKESVAPKIHQGSGTVAVRIPGSDLCRELIRDCGGLLTGTSANLSGRPPCKTAADAEEQLGEAVDLILDGGRLEGLPSTIVALRENGIEVLREGAVRVSEEAKRA